ncbi:hypothetical protein [Labrenzia sp. DG1229]|uniref:hypothetical protein n=1 Tax=Labrenzia sp. DG1229 TaxID=681847 RepID=UPI00048E34B9|nr:hypothetical protein [Labrenzia sp. DG1229]
MIRLFLGAMGFLMALPALACDRIDPLTPEQIFQDAAFVARVRVERVEYLEVENDLKQDQVATSAEMQIAAEPKGIARVFFRPIEMLKGKQLEGKPLAYFPGMAICGVMIIPGFEYLIVANSPELSDFSEKFQHGKLEDMVGFVSLDTHVLLNEESSYERLNVFRELSATFTDN